MVVVDKSDAPRGALFVVEYGAAVLHKTKARREGNMNDANSNNQFNPRSSSPPGQTLSTWQGNMRSQNPNFPSPSFLNPPQPKRTPAIVIVLAVVIPIIAGIIILAIVLLASGVFGGGYEETYEAFDELHEAMVDLERNSNCYNVIQNMFDDDVSDNNYEKYISSCVDDVVAVAKTADRFGRTYGVKHDPNVKADFEAFKSTLDTLYSNERDLRSGLDDYKTWREALSIIKDASSINAYTNSDEYFATVSRATELIKSTKVPAAIEYADGLEEKLNDLYYSVVSSSPSEQIAALNDFNEYIDSTDTEALFKINLVLIGDLQDDMNSLRDSMNALIFEKGD